MVDVDTSARAVRLNYERRMTQDRQARRQLFRQLAIDEVVVEHRWWHRGAAAQVLSQAGDARPPPDGVTSGA